MKKIMQSSPGQWFVTHRIWREPTYGFHQDRFHQYLYVITNLAWLFLSVVFPTTLALISHDHGNWCQVNGSQWFLDYVKYFSIYPKGLSHGFVLFGVVLIWLHNRVHCRYIIISLCKWYVFMLIYLHDLCSFTDQGNHCPRANEFSSQIDGKINCF